MRGREDARKQGSWNAGKQDGSAGLRTCNVVPRLGNSNGPMLIGVVRSPSVTEPPSILPAQRKMVAWQWVRQKRRLPAPVGSHPRGLVFCYG